MHSFASHRELQAHYEAQFDADVAAGKYAPFTHTLALVPALVAFTYFLVPHQKYPQVYQARYVIYAGLVAYVAYITVNFRSKHIANAFGVGLVLTWLLLWLGVMMLVHDAQAEFKMVAWGERRSLDANGRKNGHIDRNDKSDGVSTPNGPVEQRGTTSGTMHSPDMEQYHYKWQPYPLTPFSARLLWVTDLLCNFRGIAWNFHVPGPAPPPMILVDELEYYSGSKPSFDGKPGHATRKELIYHNLRLGIIGYLKLDLLKVVLMKDRYFWGFTDAGAPAYLPAFVADSPSLMQWYRLILTMVGVWTAIETIFTMSPLFFSGLLGPKWLGAHAEPWVYPDTWGSYSNIWNRGLAGFWGSFWHQTFRFAFDAPSKPVLKALGIPIKSMFGLFMRVLMAFVLSGVMHSMGSYTSAGNSIDGRTRPLSGSLVYFLTQVGGIMLERAAILFLRRIGIAQRAPKIVCQVSRFIWVHLWMYKTSPLLADDFAKAGIWLFEPVAISPLRALGFGVEGDSWWTWGPPKEWIFYHNSGNWWTSGLYL